MAVIAGEFAVAVVFGVVIGLVKVPIFARLQIA
jgi:hypothetical protein